MAKAHSLSFLVVLSLLSSISTAAQRRPAISELDRITGDLKRMVEVNQGTPIADKIEDSLAKVQSANGKLSQAPADRQGGLGDLEGAVGDIEAALNDRLLRARVANGLMERIASVARQLATRAVSDAAARRRGSAGITEAERALAAGDAERRGSRYKNAVAHYKDALSKADGA